MFWFRASIGQTTKPLPPIDLRPLPKSVLVTYPTSLHHVRTREALLTRSAELFHFVEEGKLQVSIGGRYPLSGEERGPRGIQYRQKKTQPFVFPKRGRNTFLCITL